MSWMQTINPSTNIKNVKCTICFQIEVEYQRKQEKDQIHEIEKEEFIPSKKLKVTTKIEEFNFNKIERTEIEQMKQEITNLKKLAIEQSENIKYLAKAIKIYQEMNNILHLDNIELKRKFKNLEKRDYLIRARQIAVWRNQAVTE
ncbi:2382_t:CDS:1 [Racocetra persica]|uniref:2382_t:CDS:1 n=1 Tax=Racocetra persica TaxID=160502 RepID=A0ACA9PJN9_9GLOM|nr:2382_t:CDS:1 [Racocetra persica]